MVCELLAGMRAGSHSQATRAPAAPLRSQKPRVVFHPFQERMP